jgi:hypothetical protein
MKNIALALALAVPFMASAGGFAPLTMSDPGETCYTWTGGNFSAGSFSKCSPTIVLAAVTPAPLAAPPTANPVMVPMQTCAPPPKPHHRIVKKKPPAKC